MVEGQDSELEWGQVLPCQANNRVWRTLYRSGMEAVGADSL